MFFVVDAFVEVTGEQKCDDLQKAKFSSARNTFGIDKKIKVKSVKSSSLSDLPIFTDNMKCLCFDDNASIGAKM